LLDRPTGMDIAQDFSGSRTLMLIVTANPEAVPLDSDVVVGVLAKPVSDATLSEVLAG
jgi:hypothetical protein